MGRCADGGSSAPNPETLCQVGFIVKDIEASAQRYAELFGMQPRPMIRHLGYGRAKTTVNGQPSEATARLAFFEIGQLTIELIQPDDKPSVWRDFLDKHGEGVHHIAFRVDDTKRRREGAWRIRRKDRTAGPLYRRERHVHLSR